MALDGMDGRSGWLLFTGTMAACATCTLPGEVMLFNLGYALEGEDGDVTISPKNLVGVGEGVLTSDGLFF